MRGVGAGQVVEPVPARRRLVQQVGVEELVEHPTGVQEGGVEQGGGGVGVELGPGV
jgi:hypothetical protein